MKDNVHLLCIKLIIDTHDLVIFKLFRVNSIRVVDRPVPLLNSYTFSTSTVKVTHRM